MKAVQIIAPGQLQLNEVPEPVPDSGQVLVKIVVGSICGSDLHHLFEPHAGSEYPLKPGYSGHECVGVIVTGDGKTYKGGERVLVLPPDFNGFAEFLVCDPHWLVPLPHDVEQREIVLAQQLGTVLYAARRLHSVQGANVVVLGQGPAGLLFTRWLQLKGAATIIAIDVVPHRLQASQIMGATHTINASAEDAPSAVRSLLHYGADIVIEAVGKPDTLNQLPDLVRTGGQILCYGIPPKGQFDFRFEAFFRRYATTYTSARAQLEPGLTSFHQAARYIASREIDTRPLISHELPVENVSQAFELASTRRDGAIKILLNFD